MYFQLVTEFGKQLSLECVRAVWTYHDSGADGDGPSTVRVRHDVAIADRQERDGDEPHRVEQVRVFHVVITAYTADTRHQPLTSCFSTGDLKPHRRCPLATDVEFIDRRQARVRHRLQRFIHMRA